MCRNTKHAVSLVHVTARGDMDGGGTAGEAAGESRGGNPLAHHLLVRCSVLHPTAADKLRRQAARTDALIGRLPLEMRVRIYDEREKMAVQARQERGQAR